MSRVPDVSAIKDAPIFNGSDQEMEEFVSEGYFINFILYYKF